MIIQSFTFVKKYLQNITAVNKYDDFLAQYLETQRELSLHKIGIIFKKGSTFYTESTNEIQDGDIHFQMDKKAITSPGLIEYINTLTGKNSTLISSDIESYLEQGRQFINIGDTFSINGIGSFTKNNSGNYMFNPGPPVLLKIKQEKDKNVPEHEHGSYYTAQKKKNSNRGLVMFFAFFILLLVLAGMGWGVYKLYFEKNNSTFSNTTTPTIMDTPATKISLPAETVKMITPITDTTTYKFIFEQTPMRERAVSRTAKLHEYGNHTYYDSIKENGALIYRLYLLQKTKKIADTARIRDSLFRYFQRDILIEPIH